MDSGWGFPCCSVGKKSACSVGTQVQSLGQGRIPGEGNGSTLQYSCVENSTDGGHWWVTVHGISKELDTSEQLTQIHTCIEGKYFKE